METSPSFKYNIIQLNVVVYSIDMLVTGIQHDLVRQLLIYLHAHIELG